MPKILLLGAGFVAGPCLDYLLRRDDNTITVACRTLERAQELAGDRQRTAAISLNVKDSEALVAEVQKHDIVISLIPYTYHPLVIEAAIKVKKHFVSTSYVSPKMASFDQAAKDAGITVMNEIGVDPGIDHLYAKKIIDEAHEEGSKVLEFTSYCGGLPAPEASNNPLGYKFSWSARGVLLAAGNSCKYFEHGKKVEIEAPYVLSKGVRNINIYPAFAFEGYPNRDSTPYEERYNIPECLTILRGTLRYKGTPLLVQSLALVGFLNDHPQDYLQPTAPDMAWKDVLAKMLGCTNDEASLAKAAAERAGIRDHPEERRIISAMKWLGLFSDDVCPKKVSLLDSLAHTLADKCAYQPGERDMIMMQHKFRIQKKTGDEYVVASTMLEYGIPFGATAMARTVGIPCGIAVQLILDGKITRKGVFAPMTKDIYQPLIAELEKEGIGCKEEYLDEWTH
ncbi:saccharopine dehydrogenase [Salpingoeca rosetta]|uniref:Saccharopine dehydrogenase n=1 Tax=Salpingoeca rosetta (strain ATCC 50818 / BSB-021) TaxID=946362 RepID=F2UR51_SALR5|nr:saccharopine dehydrogenase [Salpingoeca rosetta]EGD80106.1 saccharopine dehydrogenase [Salpingoeca rosetta]|eukprot:XP_004988431.1 saccharopine dehydrogenase [Salpingoeca rosetta]